MLKLPVVNVTVSLNEIPGRIAVAVELGNCKRTCKKCHSPWDRERFPYKYWMDIEILKALINNQIKLGANAIVIMGGTDNGIEISNLVEAINELSKIAEIGLYSGLEDKARIHKTLKEYTSLKWLKTGPYKYNLGGLNSPNTNQRFYECEDGTWVDRTFLFRGEKNASKA